MRVALALMLLVAAPLTGCIREVDEHRPENRVHIRTIDVAAPEVSSGSVALLVNISLDNRAADSDPLYLVVKAFDTSTGFLVETQRTSNLSLGEDKTVPVEVRLDVPRKSGYRIEVEVFEDGQIVETGQVTVRNVGALEPTVHETSLAIEAMEFLVRNISSSRVGIETQVYLTNEGADPSRPLRLQLKARDVETGLLADQAYRDVPSIEPEHTRILPVELDVPDEHNYVVEAVLWDGNLTVERGQGTVQLLPTMTKPADEDIVVSDPQIEDFLRERGSADRRGGDAGESFEDSAQETPGPTGLLVAALIGVAAIALAARRRI